MSEQPRTDLPAALSPHRPLSEFYPAPAARQNFVNELFDEAAPDYDWVSGLMSFWSDRFYRREALRRAGLQGGMQLLDVASGTGLMIKAALELGVDPAQVTGVDPSRGMLAKNRERNPVTLLEGTGEALPCADATFDFVCMGYALRHVEDLRKLFGEFHRVLRPGGTGVDSGDHPAKQRGGVALDAFLHAKTGATPGLVAPAEPVHGEADAVLLGHD